MKHHDVNSQQRKSRSSGWNHHAKHQKIHHPQKRKLDISSDTTWRIIQRLEKSWLVIVSLLSGLASPTFFGPGWTNPRAPLTMIGLILQASAAGLDAFGLVIAPRNETGWTKLSWTNGSPVWNGAFPSHGGSPLSMDGFFEGKSQSKMDDD